MLSHTGTNSNLNANFFNDQILPCKLLYFLEVVPKKDLERYGKIFFATLVKKFELALYLFSLFNYSPSLIDWSTNWLFCAKCKLLYVELPIYINIYISKILISIILTACFFPHILASYTLTVRMPYMLSSLVFVL